jgi:hypothetical protein
MDWILIDFLDLKIATDYIPPMLPSFLRGEVRRGCLQNRQTAAAATSGTMRTA